MFVPVWQRIFGFIIYMIPWSDAVPFGSNLFLNFPFLQWLVIPTLPIMILERGIPFGSLLLFILLFIGVIRNPKMPYFLRFNSLQALLIDIVLILLSYAFQILFAPFGSSLITRTLNSTVFVSVLAVITFASIECFQGKEPDIPGVSDAVRIQL